MTRGILRTIAAGLLLLAVAAVPGREAAAAGPAEESTPLAAFRKAFDGNAPFAERAFAARAMAGEDGRPAAEAVCRALGSVLERIESLAGRRSAVRRELLSITGDRDGEEDRDLPGPVRARFTALLEEESSLHDQDGEEHEVAGLLRGLLHRFRDPKAVEYLAVLPGKGGVSGPVRAAVLGALGRIGDATTVRAVRGALRDRDPAVREAALGALARLQAKEEETLRALAAGLSDERWTVRLAAARRLADLAVPGAVDLLVARLAVEDGRLRQDLSDLLRGLTGQNFGVEPEGWSHWWKDRRAAYESGEARLSVPGPGPPPRAARSEGGANYYGITIRSKRILYVIDISGSMARPSGSDPNRERVEDSKKELVRSIRALDAGSAFTVYGFHDTVKTWKPALVKATPENKADAARWIGALQASSCTNTYGALEEALRASAANPRNNMGEDYGAVADTIFLLTDGAPTTPSGALRDAKGNSESDRVLAGVREWNREKRIVIHAIGVGPEVGGQFLSTLASENGGEFVTVK